MSVLFRPGGATFAQRVINSLPWNVGSMYGQDSVLGSSMETSLRLVPLFASTRILAEQIAAAPLVGYTENGTLRDVMRPQPQLAVNPSGIGLTPFTWKFQAMTSVLLRGNAYGLITGLDDNGWPSSIDWLNPERVSIRENEALPRYFLSGREIDRRSLIHVPGYVLPGKWLGLSPLEAFKVAMETGQQAQIAGRDWFAGGAVPGGHLKNNAQTLSPDDAATAKDRFKVATSGRDLLVTGKDWEFTAIGVPADQARFIETIKMTATQMAVVYGVPPERVGGETGSSMTYQTTEQQSQDTITWSLRSWAVRFEEAFNRLTPPDQDFKFDLDAMVRADILTRAQADQVALRNGYKTINEIRAGENLPPVPWGDEPFLPAMGPSAAAAAENDNLTKQSVGGAP